MGISATTNWAGADLLYVFTSSTTFNADESYDRFAAYAVLNHGGDYRAAARELAHKGYGKAASSGEGEASEYRATAEGIQFLRHTKDGDIWTPLTNFRARIVSDVVMDDGIETAHAFEIEVELNGRSYCLTVPAQQFGRMEWPLVHLGQRL